MMSKDKCGSKSKKDINEIIKQQISEKLKNQKQQNNNSQVDSSRLNSKSSTKNKMNSILEQTRKNMSVNQESSKKILNLQQFYSGDENKTKQILILQNQIRKKPNNNQDIQNANNQQKNNNQQSNGNNNRQYSLNANGSENKEMNVKNNFDSPVIKKVESSKKLKKNLFEQFSKIQINPNLKVN